MLTSLVSYQVNLGIMLDQMMTLTPLTKEIKKKISNMIFMLRKLRKFLTFDAAVSVYKQMILPIIDYVGFMLISCRKEDRNDFQILQNDILRICNMSRLSDRVSIPYLHAKCKILSLEQRRRKQLLRLMFNLSKDKEFLKVPNRVTRGAGRVTFKDPAKIFPSYECSPFYVGTKLWDELTTSVQESVDIFAFKKEIDKLYRVYVKL